MPAQLEYVIGRVEAVNREGTGIKIDGKWFNFGKDVRQSAVPVRGQYARLGMAGNYAMTYDLTADPDDGPASPPPAPPPVVRAAEHEGDRELAGMRRQVIGSSVATGGEASAIAKLDIRARMRIAALKSAIEYLGSTAEPSEILAQALEFETWLRRGQDDAARP